VTEWIAHSKQALNMSSYRLCIFALGTSVIASSTAFSIPPPITLPLLHPSEITINLLPNSFHPTTTTTTLLSFTSQTYASISRIQFVVLLLFGSGPVLSGWQALPQVRNELDRYTLLQGGNTLGGPSLALTPIQATFLPATEPLRTKDVRHCVRVCPRAGDFPVSKLANPEATCAGRAEDLDKFVSQGVFVSALVGETGGCKCNPVAAESLWQAVSGGTSSFVTVERLDGKISAYRLAMEAVEEEEDWDGSLRFDLFKRHLGDAKMVKIRSIATLALLMGGTMGLILASGLKGFV